MMIGSLLFDICPRSKSPPPLPPAVVPAFVPLSASCTGSVATATTGRSNATISVAAARRSRRRGIALHHGVHVVEQAHVLRPHLDLHPLPLHVEGPTRDRDGHRRGDEVL